MIIYDLPIGTILKAADHIFTLCDLKESYDMIPSGTTWIPPMVTGFDTTTLRLRQKFIGYDTTSFRLRYKFTGYDTTSFRLRYQVSEYETTAYRLGSMATWYDTSAS